MNEKNRIHIPLKKVVKCAGDKAQDKKMHRIITKTNHGGNFQFAKF